MTGDQAAELAALGREVSLLRDHVEEIDARQRDMTRIDREIASLRGESADLRVALAAATTKVLRHTLSVIVATVAAAALAWLGLSGR